MAVKDFSRRQWVKRPCPCTNYTRCWMDRQEYAVQKKRALHQPNLLLAPGLMQINKPVKGIKKNENGGVVWLIVSA